jgi:probable phosphoglycerate mutase
MTMQVTRILAIRHGETAWNVDTRIQGQLDIPLNATGEWQAKRLGQALATQEQIDAIYTSDLRRAYATAQAIGSAVNLALNTHIGLRERGFGDFQAKTFAEIESSLPEDSLRWRKRDPEWAPPGGGESLLAVRDRVLNTVNQLASAHLGGNIVLVAHGGVMDILYRAATRLDLQAPRTWDLSNTAVNRLLWTPQGLSLVGWADKSHIDDPGRDETTA